MLFSLKCSNPLEKAVKIIYNINVRKIAEVKRNEDNNSRAE